jgi:hypothetical protein
MRLAVLLILMLAAPSLLASELVSRQVRLMKQQALCLSI